ncbi:MAG TPA: hypothetical protein VFT49_03805 [Candidatus Saccharimonadales bacterium]|nr:hypothetical protein [Candidatus Saccharimonadales bacterium]
MGEKINMPPSEAMTTSAKRFLDFIINFPVSDQISPETFRGFLNDYDIAREICNIGCNFGQVYLNSAGYQQLHANSEGSYMVATYYPGETAAFHAFFGPGGQHQETTAITLFEDGRPPVAQKAIPLDRYGRKQIIELDKPTEVWAEIQVLAGLIRTSLPGEQEEPQVDLQIEQLAA